MLAPMPPPPARPKAEHGAAAWIDRRPVWTSIRDDAVEGRLRIDPDADLRG